LKEEEDCEKLIVEIEALTSRALSETQRWAAEEDDNAVNNNHHVWTVAS